MTTARVSPQQKELIAIGISRVSLLKQVDNYSLESQNAKIQSLEKKFGPFSIPAGFMLDDGGYSGTNFDRPAMRTALRMIRAGRPMPWSSLTWTALPATLRAGWL
jgi:DNA invertase Pin-like site-specific DNA recombinase